MIKKHKESILTELEISYLKELMYDYIKGSWVDSNSLYNQMLLFEPDVLLRIICHIPQSPKININKFINSDFFNISKKAYMKSIYLIANDIFSLNSSYLNENIPTVTNQVAKAKNKYRKENNKCICCGKESKFKNSHTIPRYILESINSEEENKNGNKKILTISNFSNINNYFSDGVGIKKTNCFECICDNCENSLFKNYEQPDLLPIKKFNNYCCDTKNDIMRSIALKTDISSYYFYQIEKNLGVESFANLYINRDEFVSSYNYRINKLKNNFKNKYQYNKYKVLYCKVLDYNVGFSIQESINDLGGKGNLDLTKGTVYVNVFPIGNETLILIFINNKYSKKYKDLEMSLKYKNTEEVLSFLNFNILLETQHIFFDYKVFKDFKFNKYSQTLMSISDDKHLLSPINCDYTIVIDRDDVLEFLNVTENTIDNLFTMNKL